MRILLERKSVNYLCIVLLSILIFSPYLLIAQITNAEGKLIVNNELIHLKYSYAMAQEGFFDKSKEDILVIITDAPLNEKEIEDSFERRIKVSEGTLHGVEVIINSDKESISTTILHDAFEAPPSGRGYEILEDVSIKDDLISGKIFTSKPNEFFGTTYEYSATFKAAIIREIPPTEAEKSEAAKSKFAEIYREYESYIKDSDFDGLKKLVIPEAAEEMSIEDAPDMFEFMQMTMPDNVEFLRVKVNGEEASLEMSGEIDDGNLKGKVEFHFISNEWKIAETSWKD